MKLDLFLTAHDAYAYFAALPLSAVTGPACSLPSLPQLLVGSDFP